MYRTTGRRWSGIPGSTSSSSQQRACGCGMPRARAPPPPPDSPAGRGHKWQPHFAQSTPETVWTLYGLTPEQAELGGLNPKMSKSFLDGTKPAIGMTAVSNATGLRRLPKACSTARAVNDLPGLMRPRGRRRTAPQGAGGGGLFVDAGRSAGLFDFRCGVYVIFGAESDNQALLQEYGIGTDPSGRYAACTGGGT